MNTNKGQRSHGKSHIAAAVAKLFKTTIDGQQVMVGRDQLKGGWMPCHGDTITGEKVESLDIQVVGDQAFVRKPGGRIESFGANEFELSSVKYALMRGYKVIGKDGQELKL